LRDDSSTSFQARDYVTTARGKGSVTLEGCLRGTRLPHNSMFGLLTVAA